MIAHPHVQVLQRNMFALLLIVPLSLFNAAAADTNTSEHQNLVDLVGQSEQIIFGSVTRVSDGLSDENVPFTEVTLKVTESLKGDETIEYHFRQFGLLKHHTGASDLHMILSPNGLPDWSVGEEVLVFLHSPARHTGMQTTVGLRQGKLIKVRGHFEPSDGESGLFKNMMVRANDLTNDQIAMLGSKARTVDADPLLALLRRAISEHWVEKGVMYRVN